MTEEYKDQLSHLPKSFKMPDDWEVGDINSIKCLLPRVSIENVLDLNSRFTELHDQIDALEKLCVTVTESTGVNLKHQPYVELMTLSKIFLHAGLALSVALASTVNMFLLAIFIRYKGIHIFDKTFFNYLIQIAVALLPLLILVYLDIPGILVQSKQQSGTLLFTLATLSVLTLVSLSYFAILAKINPEGQMLWQSLKKKFSS